MMCVCVYSNLQVDFEWRSNDKSQYPRGNVVPSARSSHTRRPFECKAFSYGFSFFVYFLFPFSFLYSTSTSFVPLPLSRQRDSTYGFIFQRHDISTEDSRNSMTRRCLVAVQMDTCSFVRTAVHSCAHKLLIPFPISAEGPILFCFIAFHIS